MRKAAEKRVNCKSLFGDGIAATMIAVDRNKQFCNSNRPLIKKNRLLTSVLTSRTEEISERVMTAMSHLILKTMNWLSHPFSRLENVEDLGRTTRSDQRLLPKLCLKRIRGTKFEFDRIR